MNVFFPVFHFMSKNKKSSVISISELIYITFFSPISNSRQNWVAEQIESEVCPVWFCSRLTNITPLLTVHVTLDISSIHPRKPNVYTYENKTRDKKQIPANFKSTTQNNSHRHLDKKCRFHLQEGEGREKEEECLCRVRRKKERKKERKNLRIKKILSNCRITGSQNKIKF